MPNNSGLKILGNGERFKTVYLSLVFTDLIIRVFELVRRGFELITRGFEPVDWNS